MGKGALHVFYITEAVGLEVGFGGSKRNAFAFPGLPCVEGFAWVAFPESGLPSNPMSDGCVHAYNALTPVYADQIPAAAIGLITTQVKRVAH